MYLVANQVQSVYKIAEHESTADSTDNAYVSNEVGSIRARQEKVSFSNLVPCIGAHTGRKSLVLILTKGPLVYRAEFNDPPLVLGR